ncbi:hypothetical protein FKY96_14685 [Enterococcus faecalis]|nr:hypothetical protein FKY96_14685 [Enterococcus faecalis]
MFCGNSILQKGLPFFYLHKIFYTLELKSEYEKLKDLYIKQLYFDKKDFSNHIKEPGIPKLYQSIFYTFLGILALRFFVFFL